MAYTALYRQLRPKVFDDIVEQQHIVETLKNSVIKGQIAHAYLFCGTRGTGKTSTAHILSRAINCLAPVDGNPCNKCEICTGILDGSILDVLELDAASNNSVDNIRDIRDEVAYSPSHARYKVYIIDEVHMLSTGAFNALLKTLEEPPAHVVFILATTEPHRLPATVLSRCQRYDFHRISAVGIVERLKLAANEVGVSVDERALELMALKADGALRDALNLLDRCVSSGMKTITLDDVLAIAGLVDYSFLSGLAGNINRGDVQGVLGQVAQLVMEGKDIRNFTTDLITYYRNLLVCKLTGDASLLAEVPDQVLETVKKQAQSMDKDYLTYVIKELSGLEAGLRWAVNPRILLEVTLIKLCGNITSDDSTLPEKLAVLERKLESLEQNADNLIEHYSRDRLKTGSADGAPGTGIRNAGGPSRDAADGRNAPGDNNAPGVVNAPGSDMLGADYASGSGDMPGGNNSPGVVDASSAGCSPGDSDVLGGSHASGGGYASGGGDMPGGNNSPGVDYASGIDADGAPGDADIPGNDVIPGNSVVPGGDGTPGDNSARSDGDAPAWVSAFLDEEDAASAKGNSAPEGDAGHIEAKGDASLKAFDRWPNVLEALKAGKKMALFSYLLDAEAYIKGNTVVIVEKTGSVAKMMATKQEDLNILESLVEKELGRKVKLKFEMKKEETKPAGGSIGGSDLVLKAKLMASKLNISTFEVVDE